MAKTKKSRKKSLIRPLIEIGISVLSWIYFLAAGTLGQIVFAWNKTFGAGSHPGAGSAYAGGDQGTILEFVADAGILGLAVLLASLLGVMGVITLFKRLGNLFKKGE